MNEDMLIENLSWKKNSDENETAIRCLSLSISDLRKLIIPERKDIWENAARVLKNIGYPRITVVFSDLLLWLQDMTWPGAITIFELLKEVPAGALVTEFNYALNKAIKNRDWDWVCNLKLLFSQSSLDINDIQNKEYMLLDDEMIFGLY